jgi:integrase
MRLYTRSDKPGAKLYAEFQIRNKRYQWSTKTADPAKAAERANEYMQRIIDGNMGLVRKMTATGTCPTIQQILDFYEQHALDEKPSSRTNCRTALLRVLKYAGIQPSRQLDALTDTTWRTFRTRFVAGKEGDVGNSAKRTANTYMRQARSIFSRSMMRQYRAHFKVMPDLAAWLEMEYFRVPVSSFRAVATADLQRAMEACKAAGPAYHIFILLSLFAGLRYGEIRNAQWTWIEEQPDGNAIIRIPGEYAKSKKSRVIPLAADVVSELKGYRKPDWPYIAPQVRYHFSGELTAVLKKAGITARKGCHEMRKQFGAMVATRSGLYAAQKLLGHSNPALTSQIYADLISLPAPLDSTVALGLDARKTPPAPAPATQPPA